MSNKYEMRIFNGCGEENIRVQHGRIFPGKTGSSDVRDYFSPDLPKHRIISDNYKNGDLLIINDPDEFVIIKPPKKADIRRCRFSHESTEDVLVITSITNGYWKILFPHSGNTSSESPITVNVSIIPPEDEEMEPGGTPASS